MTANDDVVETILLAHAGVLPGTDAEVLANRMADSVLQLPVPAAALIGGRAVPPDVQEFARGLGERQGLAAAAEDFFLFAVRLWHRRQAGDFFPQDPVDVAVALRELWEERVQGAASGLTTIVVTPAFDPDRWLRLAQGSPWIVGTRGAPPGLIPQ
ncbi:hypothetical protein [Kitasatospora purpeofusca]|uniref:hypothetical protein n=1 Tax=Kitasatospora purpeofusca TaxID=67352 RepID=UPI0036909E58